MSRGLFNSPDDIPTSIPKSRSSSVPRFLHTDQPFSSLNSLTKPHEDVAFLRARLNDVQEELISLKKRHSSDVAYARTRVREFQSALAERDSIIESLQNDIHNLQTQLEGGRTLSDTYSRLVAENRSLTSKVEVLKSENNKVQDLVSTLKRTTSLADSLRNEVESLQEELNRKSKMIASSNIEIDQIKEQNLFLEKDNCNLKSVIVELLKCCASLKINNGLIVNQKMIGWKLWHNRESVCNQLSELSSILTSHESQSEIPQKKKSIKSVFLAVLAVVFLCKKSSTVRSRHHSFDCKLTLSTVDDSAITTSVNKLLSDSVMIPSNQILTQLISTISPTVSRLVSPISLHFPRSKSQHDKCLHVIRNSFSNMISKYKKAEELNLNLKHEFNDLSSQLDFEQQKTVSLAVSLKKSQELASHLSSRIESLQSEQLKMISPSRHHSVVQQLTSTEEVNQSLSQELSRLKSTINSLEGQLSTLSDELSTEKGAKSSLLVQVSDQEQRILLLDEELTKLEHEVENLTCKCLKNEEEIERLSGVNELVSHQLSEKQSKMIELESSVNIKSEKLVELQEESEKNEKKVLRLSQILDQKSRDLDITNQLLEKKSRELESAQDMIRSLSEVTLKHSSKSLNFAPHSPTVFNKKSTSFSSQQPISSNQTTYQKSCDFTDDDSICEEVEELKRLIKSVGY
ncbi:hypothetical protein RCL1_002306 [Eukaryota sp. TZLM3-RCL]